MNWIEAGGAIAAILAGILITVSVAMEQRAEQTGHVYVIENGKWLPIAGRYKENRE